MAAVDTPSRLKLNWNPSGRWPSVATAVHGSYHVTGNGRYDVYYQSRRDPRGHTVRIGSRLSAGDAYQVCVNHNKKTLGINAAHRRRNERPCADCGLVHAGDCY